MRDQLAPLVEGVRMGDMSAEMWRAADGAVHIRAKAQLPDYPANLTLKLDNWAMRTPERVFLADRGPDGEWRKLSFAEARRKVRALAQHLLGLGLSAERPIVALSGNDIELGVLMLAGMTIGVPVAPVSPAYSLVSKDFARLGYLFDLVTPGLVYVSDVALYRPALNAVMKPDIDLMTRESISGAMAGEATEAVDFARAKTGPDTVAKFLFTSGTTGMPKAVINTQRMLCAN